MELFDRLFDDTLWIYTAILGSIVGAIFVAYIRTTRVGIWAYSKFDLLLDYLVYKFGLTILEQDPNGWRKKYPHMRNKIDELESRIKRLEEK